MRRKTAGLAVALLALVLSQAGCGALAPEVETAAVTMAPVAEIPAGTDGSQIAMRFLEDRVRRDPLDFPALNKLGHYYLLRLRETGNATWLELAARTARASLDSVGAPQNPGGLELLAQAEFAAHNFGATRDAALRLTELAGANATRAFAWQTLCDAYVELGAYDKAREALGNLRRYAPNGPATLMREAQLAMIHGRVDEAAGLYTRALGLVLGQAPPARESVAWLRWRLGELAWETGNYQLAEQHQRDALVTFPGYYRAQAGLGRALAARGDLPGAIAAYEQVTRQLPEPLTLAALGDLYQLAGRPEEAERQYALVEQTAKLGAARGELYNRQLVLFYADHGRETARALEMARREYETRQDIYGADALAWAALAAGDVTAAREASGQALRSGTRDARLLYHAGMIARAAGDEAGARDLLRRALAINPKFDPLHAPRAARMAGMSSAGPH